MCGCVEGRNTDLIPVRFRVKNLVELATTAIWVAHNENLGTGISGKSLSGHEHIGANSTRLINDEQYIFTVDTGKCSNDVTLGRLSTNSQLCTLGRKPLCHITRCIDFSR